MLICCCFYLTSLDVCWAQPIHLCRTIKLTLPVTVPPDISGGFQYDDCKLGLRHDFPFGEYQPATIDIEEGGVFSYFVSTPGDTSPPIPLHTPLHATSLLCEVTTGASANAPVSCVERYDHSLFCMVCRWRP